MKTGVITILAILLVVLASLYYTDYKHRLKQETQQVQESRIVPFDLSEIKKIKIANKNGTFELVKKPDPAKDGEDGWFLTAPIEEPADDSFVEGTLLAALKEGRKRNPMTVSKGDLGQYGLDDSALVLTVASDSQEVDLLLGKAAPIMGDSYMLNREDPEKVYITGAQLRKAFEKKLNELRDKAVFHFAVGDIVGLAISRYQPGPEPNLEGRLAFRKNDDGNWLVTEASQKDQPIYYRADRKEVGDLLQMVIAMKPADVETSRGLPVTDDGAFYERRYSLRVAARQSGVDDDTTVTLRNLDFYGPPAEPITTGTLKSEEGGTTETLPARTEVENEAQDEAYYARSPERDLYFKAFPELIEKLDQRLPSFRDREILSMDRNDIAYIEIEAMGPGEGAASAGMTFVRQSGGDWHFASAPDREVDQVAVEKFLLLCLSLRVASYAPPSDSIDARSTGLDEPFLRVTIANEDRSVRQGFEVGDHVQPQTPLYFARRTYIIDPSGAQPSIFWLPLPDTYLDILMQGAHHYELRTLLSFDPEKVETIEMAMQPSTDQTATMTLRRTPGEKSEWSGSLRGSAFKALPDPTMDLLFQVLGKLGYDEEVSQPGEDTLKQHHMDEPPIEMKFLGADGSEVASLTLGRMVKGKQYTLVRKHGNLYYYVDPQSFLELFQVLNEIAARLQ